MPEITMRVLKQYKACQNEQRLKLKDNWEDNKESEDSNLDIPYLHSGMESPFPEYTFKLV